MSTAHNKEKYALAKTYIAEGLSQGEACARADIKPPTYAWYLSKERKEAKAQPIKTKKPSYTALPIVETPFLETGIKFSGSPKEMVAFIKELSQLTGAING